MTEPNKENLRLVVTALRSDEFGQGQGLLKRMADDGTVTHCCLGVACEIAMRNGIELEVTTFDASNGGIGYRFDGNGGNLPAKVASWLGLPENPSVAIDDSLGCGFVSAVAANDSLSWSFLRIADGFERTYKLLESDDDTTAAD